MASRFDLPLAFGADSVTLDMVLNISMGYIFFVMAGPILHCFLIGQKRCESIQPVVGLAGILAIFSLMVNLGIGFITALTLDEQTRRNANVRRWVWTFVLAFALPMLLSFLKIQWYVLMPLSVLGIGTAPIIATVTTPVKPKNPVQMEKDFVEHVSNVMDQVKQNIQVDKIQLIV
jgi:hypothetical protein